jgi:hypothetical protein
MKIRKIRSTDLYQDTAVEILAGEKSDLIVENGTVIFERQISDKILQAIADYNNGIAINVLLFSQTYKRRRAEMLMKRGMEVQR